MFEIPYGSQSTNAWTGSRHWSESNRTNRRVARVGTPAIEIRMQFAFCQNLWLWRRWNMPPVSMHRMNFALVSKVRCSTREGMEYAPEPNFVQSILSIFP